jgi:peptide/nickel transport system substrate-binding protein
VKERLSTGRELCKLHADQVWSIGIVGFGISVYGIYLAGNGLRNVPARVYNSARMRTATARAYVRPLAPSPR